MSSTRRSICLARRQRWSRVFRSRGSSRQAIIDRNFNDVNLIIVWSLIKLFNFVVMISIDDQFQEVISLFKKKRRENIEKIILLNIIFNTRACVKCRLLWTLTELLFLEWWLIFMFDSLNIQIMRLTHVYTKCSTKKIWFNWKRFRHSNRRLSNHRFSDH